MRRNAIPWLLAAALCLTLAAPAGADDALSRTFSFRPGDQLTIETERGDIQYSSGGRGEIRVTVTIERGRLEDYLELEFNERNGLFIKGEAVGRGRGVMSRFFGSSDGPNIRFLIEGPHEVDLDLSTSGGDVAIDSVRGRVNLATSGGDIDFDEIDGPLNAATSGGDINGDFVRDEASIATSGGDISIDGAGADLSVATSGGDIEIERVEGDLKAATSGGDIEADSIRGNLSARTSGGTIRASDVGGAVEAATSGGDVVLRGIRGYVEARTSGGDMEVEFSAGNGSGGDLRTSGGDLVVALPRGIGFDLDADADGGDLEIERALDVRASGARERDRIKGSIAGGGNLLRLRNNDGDIRITESGR